MSLSYKGPFCVEDNLEKGSKGITFTKSVARVVLAESRYTNAGFVTPGKVPHRFVACSQEGDGDE